MVTEQHVKGREQLGSLETSAVQKSRPIETQCSKWILGPSAPGRSRDPVLQVYPGTQPYRWTLGPGPQASSKHLRVSLGRHHRLEQRTGDEADMKVTF